MILELAKRLLQEDNTVEIKSGFRAAFFVDEVIMRSSLVPSLFLGRETFKISMNRISESPPLITGVGQGGV